MQIATAPAPIIEVSVGLTMLVAVILIHGIGIRVINLRFSRAWARLGEGAPHWRMNLLLGGAVGALAGLHLVETFVFAAPLTFYGSFPSMRDAYYFVLGSYTTVGAGGLELPERWRLLGPMIAMCGLLTFSWTASVLVSVMAQLTMQDARQARRSLERQDAKEADRS